MDSQRLLFNKFAFNCEQLLLDDILHDKKAIL